MCEVLDSIPAPNKVGVVFASCNLSIAEVEVEDRSIKAILDHTA